MKYATIGTSWITEKFISAAKTVDNTRLIACYSRNIENAKKFAEKNGAEYYFDSLDSMSKCDLFDTVYIASPNVFHYEQSKFFLINGKNVICEKPATTTKEQMEELYHLAESRNLIYAEAIMTIHTEGFRCIEKKLNDIGIIRSAHFDFYQLSSKYPLFVNGKNPNIFNPEMHTGCLMDIGVYNLYLAVGLFGKPQKIISDAVFLPNRCDAAGTSIFKYEDKSVILNYSKVGQTYSQSEIIGDKGTILLSSVSQLTGIQFRHNDQTECFIPEDVPRDNIMSGEIEFFKKMCQNRNFSDKDYLFAKNTALTVREVCDTIRKENSFLF